MTSIQDQIRRELEAKLSSHDQAQMERQQRARSIHSIRRSQQIEGGDISPFAQSLAQQYINGSITTVQMRQLLLDHYGVTPK